MSDLLGYKGKRVVIAGCFSGMGEACARLLIEAGAEVHGVDIKPSPVALASFTQLDLKDITAIETVTASIGGEIDALFNCAGLPQTFPAIDVVAVNFIGIRHWTNQWIPRLKKGGAIVSISSNAAKGYHSKLPMLSEFVSIEDPVAAMEWVRAHPSEVAEGYGFSKEALVVWTQRRSVDLIKQGIRINATLPSPTATPMMKDFEIVAGQKILDIFAKPIDRQATAEEQAGPLLLLNSPLAGFVSGVCMPVDAGFTGGVMTGLIDMQALMAEAMAG